MDRRRLSRSRRKSCRRGAPHHLDRYPGTHGDGPDHREPRQEILRGAEGGRGMPHVIAWRLVTGSGQGGTSNTRPTGNDRPHDTAATRGGPKHRRSPTAGRRRSVDRTETGLHSSHPHNAMYSPQDRARSTLLPVPAPARTKAWPPMNSTADRCSSFRERADALPCSRMSVIWLCPPSLPALRVLHGWRLR